MSILFAISEMQGPGGASVVDAAHKRLNDLELVIPYTTRPRRADGDRDDGFVFISCEVFEEMIRR